MGPRRNRAAARSQGRALALQTLYSFELNHYQDDGFLVPAETAEPGAASPVDAEAAADVAIFAGELFRGFCAERAAIDAAVDTRLENWSIARLAVIDRALLRLGAYELLNCPDTPPKVVINEYIELAKIFGSEAKTTKLVNGVLDRLAREHRPAEVAPRPTAG
jgi:N utilization substance protein B